MYRPVLRGENYQNLEYNDINSTLLLIKLLVSLLSKEPMNSGCLSGANFINFFAPFARVPKFYASKKLNSWA